MSQPGKHPSDAVLKSSIKVIAWPLIGWLIVCVVAIFFGPCFFGLPIIGMYIQMGDWLYFVVPFVLWLLINCYHNRIGLFRTFILNYLFFWLSSLILWCAFESSEFHSVSNISDLVYRCGVYPACYAACASVLSMVVYVWPIRLIVHWCGARRVPGNR